MAQQPKQQAGQQGAQAQQAQAAEQARQGQAAEAVQTHQQADRQELDQLKAQLQQLQPAAQLGQEFQRAGVNAGSLVGLLTLLAKYGPTIRQIAEEFGGLFGGGQAPGGQAQAK